MCLYLMMQMMRMQMQMRMNDDGSRIGERQRQKAGPVALTLAHVAHSYIYICLLSRRIGLDWIELYENILDCIELYYTVLKQIEWNRRGLNYIGLTCIILC